MRILPAVIAAVVLAFPAAARAEVPAKATWTEAYIETPGEPTLHVDVMRPKGVPETTKVPAIVSVGPYFGHRGDEGPEPRFKDLIEQGKIFEKGYALVQVDLRGFGGSAGCNDFGGRGEQNDAKRAVEWTAAQPWSTGKVAMYGKSYDAWTAVMGMSEKPKGLAAAIIQSPIIDGYRTLYQHGVHYDVFTYPATTNYQVLDATPPTPFDSPEYFAGAAAGTNPACYASNAAQPNAWQDPDDAAGYWAERALPNARGSTVPSLWSHGFNDENTRPDNFLPLYSTLTGPKRAWWGQFAHDRGSDAAQVGKPGFFEDVMRWLDFYLKGEGADPTAEPQVEIAEGDGRWRYEAQWPPADAVTRTLAIKPGSFTDAANPGDFGAGSDTWSITAPFAAEARIAGTPIVHVDAASTAPRAHLFAQLFDVDEKGHAVLMHRAAHVVKGSPGRLTFEMFPNDWTVRAGHRLALRLTADDTRWYAPPHSGAPVEVVGGTLEIPFLAFQRGDFMAARTTPSMIARSKLQLAPERLAEDVVAFEQPRPLSPRPKGTEQGEQPAPVAARPPANRLSVSVRRVKRRQVRVTVAGVGASRVRIAATRGRRVIAKRVVRSRAGTARFTFRLRKAGRYRFTARVLDGVSLSGISKPLRVR